MTHCPPFGSRARDASIHRDDTLIATTLDASIQASVERLAAQEQPYFGEGTSLAIVVVENRTRNVVAYLGGVDFWGKSGQVDLAWRRLKCVKVKFARRRAKFRSPSVA